MITILRSIILNMWSPSLASKQLEIRSTNTGGRKVALAGNLSDKLKGIQKESRK